jgi:hypothetical protein
LSELSRVNQREKKGIMRKVEIKKPRQNGRAQCYLINAEIIEFQ